MDKRGGIKLFRRKNFVSQCRKVRRGILYCCIIFGYRKSLDKRGEYQDFPSKIFCLTVRKFSVGESFTVALISGIEKVWIGGGVSRFSAEKILSHSAEKSVGESFTVALVSGIEKVWIRGGSIKIFRRKFFCLTVRKFSVGESFTVAVISGSEKVCGQEGEGSIKIFRRIFLSYSAENLPRESFTVALISGTEKVWIRGGGIKIFRRKNFVSQCRKVRRVILYCCISFGYRKSLYKRGEYQDFPSKIFCLTVRKFSVGESFTLAVISGSEKVHGQEGGGEYQDFPSKNFCITVPKTSVGNPLLFHLFPVSKKFGWEGGGEYPDTPPKFFCIITVSKKFVGETFTVALISGTEKVWRRGGGVSRYSVEIFLSHHSLEKVRR